MIPETESAPIPDGLEPIASETIIAPQWTKTVVNRREVQK